MVSIRLNRLQRLASAAMLLALVVVALICLQATPLEASPGSAVTAAYGEYGLISGTVTNLAGEPLAGISVTAKYRVQIGFTEYMWYWEDFCTTGADGIYSLSVRPGSYRLEFVDPAGVYLDITRDDIIVSGFRELNQSMEDAASFSGTVLAQNGQPLPGTTIYVEQYLGGQWNSGGSARADDYGRYRVGGLAPGVYKVWFWPPAGRYNEFLMQSYNDKPTLDSADFITVTDGSDFTGIDATLHYRRPDLRLSIGQPFWASYAQYTSRRLSVPCTVTNAGARDAYNVSFEYAVSSQGVTWSWPMPWLGDIASGSSATATLAYYLPAGVTAFRTTPFASAEDSDGINFYYPH